MAGSLRRAAFNAMAAWLLLLTASSAAPRATAFHLPRDARDGGASAQFPPQSPRQHDVQDRSSGDDRSGSALESSYDRDAALELESTYEEDDDVARAAGVATTRGAGRDPAALIATSAGFAYPMAAPIYVAKSQLPVMMNLKATWSLYTNPSSPHTYPYPSPLCPQCPALPVMMSLKNTWSKYADLSSRMEMSGMGLRGSLSGIIGDLTTLEELSVPLCPLSPSALLSLSFSFSIALCTEFLLPAAGPTRQLITKNWFTHEFPNNLSKLVRLQNLQVWSNYFNHTIPPGLGNLRNLYQLCAPPSLHLPSSLLLFPFLPLPLPAVSPHSFLYPPRPLSPLPSSSVAPLSLFRALNGPSLCLQVLPASFLKWPHLPLSSHVRISPCRHLNINYFKGGISSNPSCDPFCLPPPLSLISCPPLTLSASSTRFHTSSPLTRISPSRHLNINYFKGGIPNTFSQLTNLYRLFVSSNLLSGTFPSVICTMTTLRELRISGNHFEGTIPPCISRLKLLYYMYVDTNKFTGRLPASIGTMTNLQNLFMSSNPKLTGRLPRNLGNMSFLPITLPPPPLPPTNNPLTPLPPNSSIPSHHPFLPNPPASAPHPPLLLSLPIPTHPCPPLCTLSNHVRPSPCMPIRVMEYCNFSGPIPPSITRLTRLQRVLLDNNYFRGIVPENLSRLTDITILYLERNFLYGTFPKGISSLPKLSYL
ncbi:unnamed protein product [Closterium sp. Naga37s-1]|nr:unnamed protein product [Closterium sp. Naga37s-1]